MDIPALREKHPGHWAKAAAVRMLAMDAVAAANSGHSGMPMGMADVATVLFAKHLKFSAARPDWPDRDRFIVSNGHGSMLLYAILHLAGYEDMTIEQLKRFRQLGSACAGHPERELACGIETTTGPLGQGLANAVGFAIAEESLRARYGREIVDHHTYVLAGDGCLMEGISHEAVALAGRQELSRLIVLFDDNGITIDGEVSLADRVDQIRRFEAAGWRTTTIDGHDPDAIDAAVAEAKESVRPTMIACKTHIGLGSAAQDTAKAHGALTDDQLIADTRAAYGWEFGPFEITDEIKTAWKAIGARGDAARSAWEQRLAAQPDTIRSSFLRVQSGETPYGLPEAIGAFKKARSEAAEGMATRKASEMVLAAINPLMHETIGGSADLTGSNNTRSPDMEVFSPENRGGRYIHYGIREHGMAAAMNGMALHGGVRPYGGTFLVFSDYARAAMRLSALMEVATVYVMTHDSIGVGEDGPTHQPVEQLASLRAMPNMLVIRPADAVETVEAWEIALSRDDCPSVLALTRQTLPPARTEHEPKNLTSLGAYVLAEAEGKLDGVLIATGSEVSIALAAREMLQAEGVGARVVSMPCWELFERQDETYRRKILPPGPARVAIEAGVSMGWGRWLCGEGGREDRAGFVGMTGFGASAPAGELFKHFGITAESVAETMREIIGRGR